MISLVRHRFSSMKSYFLHSRVYRSGIVACRVALIRTWVRFSCLEIAEYYSTREVYLSRYAFASLCQVIIRCRFEIAILITSNFRIKHSDVLFCLSLVHAQVLLSRVLLERACFYVAVSAALITSFVDRFLHAQRRISKIIGSRSCTGRIFRLYRCLLVVLKKGFCRSRRISFR